MDKLSIQLPNSYIEIEKDEMEYIDGGGTLTLKISKSTLQFAISRSVWAAGSFLGALAGNSLAGPFGTKAGIMIGGVLGGIIGSSIGGFIASRIAKSSVTIRYSSSIIPFNYSLAV